MTIIDRLQKATGPDRELDALIYCAEHGAKFVAYHNGWLTYELNRQFEKPITTEAFTHFTASIDAALALVERMLPGHPINVRVKGRGEHDTDYACIDDGLPRIAETPALAILTALFAALQGKDTPHADK